jgi:hypothetical protein
MGFDIKKLLSTVAPMLGTALGGPLCGAAASILVSKLGGNTDPKDPAAVQEALAQAVMTPDGLAKLKEAEMDFQVQMKTLDIKSVYDLEKLDTDDRSSARQREMTIRDKIPAYLAAGVTTGFFGLLYYLLRHSPPADSKDVLNIMLGSLGTAWVSIIAYYFGSSSGSAAKNEMLAAMGEKK